MADAAYNCHGCKKDIESDAVKAMDVVWHSDCFVCKKCQGPFETSFVNIKGDPYHENCTNTEDTVEFSDCGSCGKTIEDDEAVRVRGVDYHRGKCFSCHACGKSLEKSYVSVEGKIYCTDDGCAPTKVVGRGTNDTNCKGCSGAFEPSDRLVRAEGNTYHASCWTCAGCKKAFDRETPFVMHEGLPYHKTDDGSCLPEQVKNEATCFKCMKLIQGRKLEIDGGKRVFHSDCFVCYKCNGEFTDGYVEDEEGPRHQEGKCQ